MDINSWLVFSILALTSIVTPGPAILLAINNGVSQGFRAVLVSSLGNIIGLFILSALAMLGIGAILKTSSTLFGIFKFIGAGYLVYLGIYQIRNRFRKPLNATQIQTQKKSGSLLFKEAFLIAITNPKPMVFFMALFPIFVESEVDLLPQFFILTLSFMFYSYITLLCYGGISKTLMTWLDTGQRLTCFQTITGGIFIAMGIGLLGVEF